MILPNFRCLGQLIDISYHSSSGIKAKKCKSYCTNKLFERMCASRCNFFKTKSFARTKNKRI